MKNELTIEFPSEDAMRIFGEWLCDGGGEQDYFASCEQDGVHIERIQYRPENYALPRNNKNRYGEFLADRKLIVHAATETETPQP
jgi:hypothetical protein